MADLSAEDRESLDQVYISHLKKEIERLREIQEAPSLNREGREHPSYDNPLDPFASPDRLPEKSAATEREVIAQALCGADGNGFLQDCTDTQRRAYMIRADAVISVLPQAVPEGYALVPLTPTPEMIEAGCDNNPTQWNEGTNDGFAADVASDVYVSMVRAASQLSRPQSGGES